MMTELDLKKEFGVSVKQERKRQRLSQETLAERAGLHRTYVTDIECGTRNPSLESIFKLADALGIKASALFERIEGMRLPRPNGIATAVASES